MELRHLRYFVVLAEELHFARAAERLRIAQPGLTQQIQALERELGVRLFHRTKRSVELSDAGVLLLEEARLTLAQAERAELVARRAGRGELGRVEIGYVGSAAYSGVLSATVFAFRQAYPEVDLRLREMDMERQLTELGEGRLDIGFIRPPVRDCPPGVIIATIFTEPVIVALRRDHPLAAREAVAIAALADEPFITTHLQAGVGFYEHTMAVCRQGGFTPRVAQKARQFATIISLVGAGLGVAIVPDSLRRVQLADVVYRPLADASELAELAIAFRRDEPSPAVKAFLQKVRDGAEPEARPAALP